MTRVLPGVYTSLNDLSTLPEGATTLTVGYVLKANRGPIGQCELVTSPTDFLTKYTFSGKPSPTDDWAYHSILKDLAYTNQMYISRAANNALYGGLVVKKETSLGLVTAMDSASKTITISGNVTGSLAATNIIRTYSTTTSLNGRYTVTSFSYSAPSTVVTVAETPVDYNISGGVTLHALKTAQPVPFSKIQLGATYAVDKDNHKFTIKGNLTPQMLVADRVELRGSANNSGMYTIVSRNYIDSESTTEIVVKENITNNTADGTFYRNSIANPNGYSFAADDLFLVTGIDQGAYNANTEIEIVSSTETPAALTEKDVFTLAAYDNTTNTLLETFMTSLNTSAKATDGSALYIEDVINESSAYIKVVVNPNADNTALPCNTITNVALSGGYDGDTLTEADEISALELFANKTIPISILANGSCETPLFQQSMIAIAQSRKDIFYFLNSRNIDEQATLPSVKAQNIVTYKKETLASTDFYGCMYAVHGKVADTYNSRNVTIGADAVAIAGWLNVINSKGYPYAYAGPTDGLVSGITCPWKIGDESGEATLLNDASINYIAYDPKQGRYYMQCQNTLQIANSAMRNIGTVLNILNIKETLQVYFKEFLQKPITSGLRQQILNKGNDFMNTAKDQGRVTDFVFKDTSTDTDISDNTLRYLLEIAPTPYAQKIYLVMNIVNQTFDFSILQSV